jgi:hypothetical protein
MIWVGGNYNMLSPFALWLLIRRWITMSVHFQSVEEKPRLSANHTRDPTCFRDRHAPALSFDWMSSKSSHRNHQHLGSARGWLLQVRGRKQGAKEGENSFNSALADGVYFCQRKPWFLEKKRHDTTSKQPTPKGSAYILGSLPDMIRLAQQSSLHLYLWECTKWEQHLLTSWSVKCCWFATEWIIFSDIYLHALKITTLLGILRFVVIGGSTMST